MPLNTAGSEAKRPGELAGRARHAGWLVVGLTLLGSLVLGVAFFFVLARSERHLSEVRAEMLAAGKTLDVPGCVDHVLAWRARCEAISPLCDQSVDPFIDTCLLGQDRRAFCTEALAGRGVGSTAFEYEKCTALGHERGSKQWRDCATAWRTVAVHCEGRKLVELL